MVLDGVACYTALLCLARPRVSLRVYSEHPSHQLEPHDRRWFASGIGRTDAPGHPSTQETALPASRPTRRSVRASRRAATGTDTSAIELTEAAEHGYSGLVLQRTPGWALVTSKVTGKYLSLKAEGPSRASESGRFKPLSAAPGKLRLVLPAPGPGAVAGPCRSVTAAWELPT